MSGDAMTARRFAVGAVLVGLSCAALTMPAALADPETTDPAAPTTSAAPTTEPAETTEPAAPLAADSCSGAAMMNTVSSVTDAFGDYLEKHPDANQALIDITRQPAFVAVGQMDGYFADHPDQADDLRAIQAPLAEFKNRCGLQVAPTDALAVLADI